MASCLVDRPINFESKSHTSTIMEGLNELRHQEMLLDVTLVADGKSFKAHRVVLASCSDYFRAMFTDSMLESRQSEIRLNGVSAIGIEHLINYAYTSKLKINIANIQDILATASHIQMNDVVAACTNYLESQLDIENCVDLLTISERYSLQKFHAKCCRFICGQLHTLSHRPEFKQLTWQQFKHILASDYPVDCHENIVLHITLQWIVAQDADANTVKQLLGHVRFPDISLSDIKRILNDECIPRDSHVYSIAVKLANDQRQLRTAIISTSAFPMASTHNPKSLMNLRGLELALVNVGGFRQACMTNDLTYYSPRLGRWQDLSTIPHVEQTNFGAAVFENEVYIVGGCYNMHLTEYIHPFGFVYNPVTDNWRTIKPMGRDRCRFSLNFVDGLLYAVGGDSDSDETDEQVQDLDRHDDHLWNGRPCIRFRTRPDVSACERYNPESDSWIQIASLPARLTQHAAAGYGGHLYISGGLNFQNVSRKMFRYDVQLNYWKALNEMPRRRADHVMLVVNNKLIVCGGWSDGQPGERRKLIDEVDVYDPSNGTWSVMTQIPSPKFHSGIVAVESKLYVIGGVVSESLVDRGTTAIDCYDIEKNEWSALDRHPQTIWECSTVALYVPKFRDGLKVNGLGNDAVAKEQNTRILCGEIIDPVL